MYTSPPFKLLFIGVLVLLAIISFGCEPETLSLQTQEAVNSDFLVLTTQDITELTSGEELFEVTLAQKLGENTGFESYREYFAGVEENLSLAEANDSKPFENPLDLQDRFNVTVKDSDDGFEVIPSVNSYVLRSIVNKYGIVQIDETIYQYDGEIAAKVPATKVIDFTDLFSHPDAKLETYVGGNVDETELKRNLEGLCNINYANHGLNEL